MEEIKKIFCMKFVVPAKNWELTPLCRLNFEKRCRSSSATITIENFEEDTEQFPIEVTLVRENGQYIPCSGV